MNEMGHKLYDRLLTASPFIFALVGVEVDEITSTTEIANDIQEDNYVGLVVTTKIWEQANQPKSFIPFNDGYYWHPYEGEK